MQNFIIVFGIRTKKFLKILENWFLGVQIYILNQKTLCEIFQNCNVPDYERKKLGWCFHSWLLRVQTNILIKICSLNRFSKFSFYGFSAKVSGLRLLNPNSEGSEKGFAQNSFWKEQKI